MLFAGSQAYAQVVVGAGGDPDHMNGFYLGGGYNFHLGEHFGFTPGLYFHMLFQGKNMTDGGNFGGIMVSGQHNIATFPTQPYGPDRVGAIPHHIPQAEASIHLLQRSIGQNPFKGRRIGMYIR